MRHIPPPGPSSYLVSTPNILPFCDDPKPSWWCRLLNKLSPRKQTSEPEATNDKQYFVRCFRELTGREEWSEERLDLMTADEAATCAAEIEQRRPSCYCVVYEHERYRGQAMPPPGREHIIVRTANPLPAPKDVTKQ